MTNVPIEPNDPKLGGMANSRLNLVIDRPERELASNHIQHGRDILLSGPRFSGKSTTAFMISQELKLKDFSAPTDRPTYQGAPWKTAFVDLDNDTAETTPRRLVTQIAEELKTAVPQASHFFHTQLQEIQHELRSPLLIVLDEIDALTASPSGEDLLKTLRSTQDHKARLGFDRFKIAFLFAGLSPVRQLLRPGMGVKAEARTDLLGESIELKSFGAGVDHPATQTLTDYFASKGLRDPNSLALRALEESGGYPLLCMVIVSELVNGSIGSGPDLDTFLNTLPYDYKHSRPPEKRSFLEIPNHFFADSRFSVSLRRDALALYIKLLDVATRRIPTIDRVQRMNDLQYRSSDERHRLLCDSGLVRVSPTDHLATHGRFMESYFDLEWAYATRNAISRLSEDGAKRLDRLSDRKLLVLLTGGTIGMLENDGSVSSSAFEAIREAYGEVEDLFNIVEMRQVFSMDSVNISPSDWVQLSNIVATALPYTDGVVVAHGTDTMAFTASAVAYALGPELAVPVVFTGSQATPDVRHADARANLLRACLVASDERISEVVISFDNQIHRAVRAEKIDDQNFAGIASVGAPPIGTVSERVRLQTEMLKSSDHTRRPRVDGRTVKNTFESGFLVVPQAPGIRPEYYMRALLPTSESDSTQPVRGVIIQSLGAGNVPNVSPGYDICPLIRAAVSRRIPVVLTAQYPVDPENIGKYQPPLAAIRAGAVPLANMTFGALVAKFSWALGQTIKTDQSLDNGAFRDLMWSNLVGEVDEDDSAVLADIFEREHTAND